MKLTFAKAAYDKMTVESRARLTEVKCDCAATGQVDVECLMCDGHGLLWESPLSAEDQAAIQENFRRQGIQLGKAGTQ